MEKNNTSGIQIWDSMPIVVRWILYVPVVLVTTLIFSFLFNMLSMLRGDLEGFLLYLQTPLAAGLTVTVFVWLSLNLAPRANRICAWLLYSLWSVFILMSLFRFFAIAFLEDNMQIQQTDTIELLQGIPWLVVGIFFLIRWGKEYKNVNSNQK